MKKSISTLKKTELNISLDLVQFTNVPFFNLVLLDKKKVNCGYSDRFHRRKSEGLSEYRKERRRGIGISRKRERECVCVCV